MDSTSMSSTLKDNWTGAQSRGDSSLLKHLNLPYSGSNSSTVGLRPFSVEAGRSGHLDRLWGRLGMI